MTNVVSAIIAVIFAVFPGDSLMEFGGDWERRNRLKSYKAFYLMLNRKFAESAALLVESISTFDYPELIGYKTFVSYTIIMGLLCLGRSEIKEKVPAVDTNLPCFYF